MFWIQPNWHGVTQNPNKKSDFVSNSCQIEYHAHNFDSDKSSMRGIPNGPYYIKKNAFSASEVIHNHEVIHHSCVYTCVFKVQSCELTVKFVVALLSYCISVCKCGMAEPKEDIRDGNHVPEGNSKCATHPGTGT